MTYAECLQYLEKLGNEVLTMKLGLENIRRLLAALGDPQRRYPAVIIGGTNGKGSVARYVHGALDAAGVKAGLYTSPHLVRVEERIVVGDRAITRSEFAESFTAIVDAISTMAEQPHPTYFETITAAAFLHFASMDIDIAVLEVGLGGRLDSTNVVSPQVSVLTPISLDHQNILGDRLEDIAREKAGIIHPGVPVVTAIQADPARTVIESVASAKGSRVCQVDPNYVETPGHERGRYRFRWQGMDFQLSSYGAYQVGNAVLALETIELLKRSLGLSLQADRLKVGIEKTRHGAVLAKLGNLPPTFVDGGHNLDAARQLQKFLVDHTDAPRVLVLGMMRDKEIRAFFEILKPAIEGVFLVPVDSPRAAPATQLKALIAEGIPAIDPLDALTRAQESARTVLVAGSFYLAGQLLAALEAYSVSR